MIVIDGVAPSIVRDYLFDIELVPGAQPSRAQLPKMSPAEMEKERYHIEKEQALGHLRVPTDEQKSDWSCRTHIVSKKDDPMGRWICDFRALNKSTVKRPTPIGDVPDKARKLAKKRWKSFLDALSGFNQMGAKEKDKRRLQIITHLGVSQ